MRPSILALPLLLMALFTPLEAFAQPPQQMLEQLSEEMLDTLELERETILQHPETLFELVEDKLIAYVDLERMSRWVLGKHWRNADANQQRRFKTEFRTLLVRFYVSALLDQPSQIGQLLDHRDGLLRFQPARIDSKGNKAVVRASVHLPEGREVPVLFQLHHYDEPWRIYDVSVENISLVKLYRDNFGSAIQQKGLDAMLDELEARNARLLAKAQEQSGKNRQ